MKDLSAALDAVRLDDVTFRLAIEDGWQQGRGAYGGLVIGALVRAAMAAMDDPLRHPRTVTAELLGPVLPGDATLKVEPLRRGAGVVGVRVRLLQAPTPGAPVEELCQAVIVFAKDRPMTPTWRHLTPPLLPAWRDVPAVALPSELAPAFTRHFEFRPYGVLPYSGAPVATAEGFVRPLRTSTVDAAVVTACADAWWPAMLSLFQAPRPAATITFMLELYDVCAITDEPLWHEGRSDVAAAGYASERRALWTPSGQLVALNHQVFAIIR
jgi:acyl-CoA thioesterase